MRSLPRGIRCGFSYVAQCRCVSHHSAFTGVTGPALGEVSVPTRLFRAPCPGVGAITIAVASPGAAQRCPRSLSTVLLVCTGSSGMGLLGVAVPVPTLYGGKG